MEKMSKLVFIILCLQYSFVKTDNNNFNYKISKCDIIDIILVQKTLINTFYGLTKWKCMAKCNQDVQCLTILFSNQNSTPKCTLLNAFIGSNNYVISKNSIILEKKQNYGIVLTGHRINNDVYLNWNVNELSSHVFLRYYIEYTSDYWHTTYVAPGMLINIPTNYHHYDFTTWSDSTYLNCLGPCILNLNCYSTVYINGFCFLKSSTYAQSTSTEDCLNNTVCWSFALDPTYKSNYMFQVSTAEVNGFRLKLYDETTSLWSQYSNLIYM